MAITSNATKSIDDGRTAVLSELQRTVREVADVARQMVPLIDALAGRGLREEPSVILRLTAPPSMPPAYSTGPPRRCLALVV